MFDDYDTQIQCEEVYDFEPTEEDYMEHMTPCGLVGRECDCFVCSVEDTSRDE